MRTTLSKQEHDELQPWDLDGLLTTCTRGICWTCKPGRRTPCQYLGNIHGPQNSLDHGTPPLRHYKDNDLHDRHNKDIDHRVQQQLGNLDVRRTVCIMGRPLHRDRASDDLHELHDLHNRGTDRLLQRQLRDSRSAEQSGPWKRPLRHDRDVETTGTSTTKCTATGESLWSTKPGP